MQEHTTPWEEQVKSVTPKETATANANEKTPEDKFAESDEALQGLLSDVTVAGSLVSQENPQDLDSIITKSKKLITQEIGVPVDLSGKQAVEAAIKAIDPHADKNIDFRRRQKNIKDKKASLAAQEQRAAEVKRKHEGRRMKFDAAVEKANFRQFTAFLETHYKGVDFSDNEGQERINVARAIFQNGKNAEVAHRILQGPTNSSKLN